MVAPHALLRLRLPTLSFAMTRRMKSLLVCAMPMLLVACQAPSPPTVDQAGAAAPAEAAPAATAPAPATTAAPAAASPAPAPAAVTPAQFADRVWRVKESSTVEPGTTYSFLGNGTLVIESPHGTPLRGEWRFQDGALTMVEEGQAYPTEILQLDGATFRIRSHNPGEPVDILLVAASDAPLPAAK
jgi:zona occludens toxin (predicted ATPase)